MTSGATDERLAARTPRSLADWLRVVPDEDLVTLLTERPDLVHPVPPDLAVLSARATARPSVLAALDRLDTFLLEVVDALVALPDPTPYDDVVLAVGADEPDVRRAVDALRRVALVWGSDDALHIVRTVREVIPEPAGLGPDLATALAGTSTGRIRDVLADLDLPGAIDRHSAVETLRAWTNDRDAVMTVAGRADDAAREVLERLAWGPPLGTVTEARRAERGAEAGSPVRWLLAHGLLVAVDDRHVVMPREIALAVRGGRLHRETHPEPPAVPSTPVDPERCAHTAITHGLSAIRAVEELLDYWSAEPPGALRTGGIGVRDVRRTATRVDLAEPVLAVFVETAYAAGLLARHDALWLPTPSYDVWRTTGDADRWVALVRAWLETSRVAGLAADRDDGGDRVAGVLAQESDRSIAPAIRAATMRVLAELPPNTTTTTDAVTECLRWRTPRRGGRLRDDVIRWTFTEAELLGLTGAHSVAEPGRALLKGDVAGAVAAFASLLPTPVDHVLVQADLTAIAPGPLTRDLARALALLADVESTGHATVFRFSESSVRRALDAGQSATDIHEFLATHSKTAIPQPLTYLIDDLARRHGRIRVGAASSYIRCDDPAVVAELLASKGAAGLRLRRLAPTVVATDSPPDRVLTVLRELGHAPAAESVEGDVVIAPTAVRRASTTAIPSPVTEPAPPPHDVLVAAVRALRAGDRASTAPRRPVEVAERSTGVMPSTSSARTLLALQDAVHEGRALWIGYVNAQGRATQRVVEPMSVEGGYLRAFDHLRDEVRTFAVHRITGVAELVDDIDPDDLSGETP